MNMRVERQLFYLCCLLTAAPLLFCHYPPMVDLPQHAAQIAAFNSFSDPQFPFKHLYFIEWIRPYLGGYVLLWALSQHLPMLVAAKLLTALALIALPLITSHLRQYFNSDPMWDWLSLPMGYGFAFHWGLFNFLLGVPVVLLFLYSAFRYSDAPNWRNAIWMGLFANILLFIHLLVAAFSCGTAILFILFGSHRWNKRLLIILPFLSVIPTIIIYMYTWVGSSAQANEPGPWSLGVYRFIETPSYAFGLHPTKFHALVGYVLLALPFLTGARFTSDRRRLAVCGALLLWLLVGPNYIWGNYYTYNRFSIFLIPLLAIATVRRITPGPGSPRFTTLITTATSYALPVLLLMNMAWQLHRFEKENSGFGETIKIMQPYKRTLGLIVDKYSLVFNIPAYVHFASWYQAENRGVSDFSFSQFGLLMSYRADAPVAIPRGFEQRALDFNWERNQGWLYDYFLVRAPEDKHDYFFSVADCPVKLISHHGNWWLYETDFGQDSPVACTAHRHPSPGSDSRGNPP